MSENTDKDYVLGTHDEEISRLGLQHRVWRPTVLECWRNAGLAAGMRVVDVGAGPGYATIDLAEIVGLTGHVLAVERSRRFIEAAETSCRQRQLSQVTFQEADIMLEPIQAEGYDAAWCRWVASFVSSPAMLMRRIRAALKPGGIAIFHEYSNYATWQLAPPKPQVESFVSEVMASWRAQGGEPNVALQFPRLLSEAGFSVRSVKPRMFAIRPGDEMWQWPASFIEINLKRLQDLGRVTAEWAEGVRAEFLQAQTDPTTWLTTPLVLEIVASALT
jgi:ubiquinone/menaquinone biosynthesis C-methylase UbiE